MAVDGSTTRPPWLMTARPCEVRRRAAHRVCSKSGRQSAPPTSLAASLGQMVLPLDPLESSRKIATSSSLSTLVRPRFRHAAEQCRTSSQDRSHFFRHCIVRPQTTQTLVSSCCTSMSLTMAIYAASQHIERSRATTSRQVFKPDHPSPSSAASSASAAATPDSAAPSTLAPPNASPAQTSGATPPMRRNFSG